MNSKLKYAIGFLIFIGLCFIFQWRAGQISGAETLVWYSIIPPLLAVTLAIVTARLFPSLCIAVGVGLAALVVSERWDTERFCGGNRLVRACRECRQ